MRTGKQVRRLGGLLVVLAVLVHLGLAGCSGGGKGTGTAPAGHGKEASEPTPDAQDAEIKAERGKLSPDDRALADAQEWCAVNPKPSVISG